MSEGVLMKMAGRNGVERRPSKNGVTFLPLDLTQLSWGWITPGTTTQLRQRQEGGFLRFWRKWGSHRNCRFLFTHCGWYFDRNPGAAAARLTRQNPEPCRDARPVSEKLLALWRAALRKKQIEFVVYPYAGCVAEATDGETLLRSLRLSREAASDALEVRPAGLLNHDAPYGVNWGAEQMPQMARLLGLEYLVAGKTGIIDALDGGEIPCVGSSASLLGILRAMSLAPRRTPQFVSWEMHDHLHFLDQMLSGDHPLIKMQPVELHSLTRQEFQRSLARVPARFPAGELGGKGWFGGLVDALMIEQAVYRSQRLLVAGETRQALEGTLPANPEKRIEQWKRSLILTDTAILWQCHDYRRHYRIEAEKLLHEVHGQESGKKLSGAARVFNPVSWRRGGVLWDDSLEVPVGMHPGLDGWQTDRLQSVPALKRQLFLKSVVMPSVSAGYRLDAKGGCWRGPNPGKRGRGVTDPDAMSAGIQRLEETPQERVIPLVGGAAPLSFTGNAHLEIDWKLTAHSPSTYLFRLECAEILGDAYLLECEYLDLLGNMRHRTLHPLRRLDWEASGMPRHHSHPLPIELDIGLFQHVRLKIHVACEGGLQFHGLRAVPLRGPTLQPVEFTRAQARLHTAVRYRPVEFQPVEIRRWGGEIAEARYRVTEPDFGGSLRVRSEKSSPWVQYHLVVHCDGPAPLGWHTPPLAATEGSFLGAGCERPYMPGLLFETCVKPGAHYFGDTPFYLREMFQGATEAWHTNSPDWWMGFSPFVATQLAVARDTLSTHLLATRGLRHFFRRRERSRETLGLSLGSGLPHPLMQGFSVPESSPLFPVIGHSYHNPYRNASMLQAQGRYDYHFASACTGHSTTRPALWKMGQEFANPLMATNARAHAGIGISSANVVATACERRGRTRILRLLNLSSRPATTHVQESSRIPSVTTQLPPHGLREISLSNPSQKHTP